MPMSCSVLGCVSRYKPGSKIKFFGYPFKNPKQLELWMNAARRTDWRPSPSSKIYNMHFKETDFILGLGYQNTQLKQDAISSIFPHTSSVFKKSIDHGEEHPSQVLKQSNLNSQDLPSRIKFAKELLTKRVDILSTETSQSAPDELPNNHPDKENKQPPLKKETTATGITQEAYMVLPMFSGSSSSSDTSSPTTKKDKSLDLHKRVKTLSRKVKTLKEKIRRRDRKINVMKDMFAQLKEKNLINNDPLIIIKNQFEGMPFDIFKNELKNQNRQSSGRRYSDEIKEFALTLHYHSPKAYSFCRSILKLPHPSSIRNWMLSVNAEPGFLSDVFVELSKLSLADRDCNLILDSMAIRKQVIWDQRRHCYTGYCDYGNSVRLEGAESEASEALVFMLVALNGKWKWPVGYFLKCRMTALTQAELVKSALTLSKKSGQKVWSVICDGTSVNFSMFKQLGCKIFGSSYENVQSKFKHPSADYYVYAILDACHMLKLARNAFAKYLFLSSNGSIQWQLIVALHTLQRELTFKFKTRLSAQCIAWYQNKMKVRYAAQTLSASVANALEFLQKEGCPEFKDCEATITFLQKIDRLFDFMNSRSPFEKGFKEPLKRSNLEYLSRIITEHIQYLFQLRYTNDRLLHTGPRKAFIYGFAVTAKSILDVAKNLFAENCSYKLLTYKFSQDHLELLFAQIRSRHGWNNNPNVIQFKYAMKQILMRNSLTASKSGNCIALDSDPVGSVFSFKWYKKNNENDLYKNLDDDELAENDTTIAEVEKMNGVNSEMPLNSELRDNILYYIGGYVLKRFLPYIHCDSCVNSHLNPERTQL